MQDRDEARRDKAEKPRNPLDDIPDRRESGRGYSSVVRGLAKGAQDENGRCHNDQVIELKSSGCCQPSRTISTSLGIGVQPVAIVGGLRLESRRNGQDS